MRSILTFVLSLFDRFKSNYNKEMMIKWQYMRTLIPVRL